MTGVRRNLGISLVKKKERRRKEDTFCKCLKISRLLCHETRRVSNKTEHILTF